MDEESGAHGEHFEKSVVFDADLGPVWRGVSQYKTMKIGFDELPKELRPDESAVEKAADAKVADDADPVAGVDGD